MWASEETDNDSKSSKTICRLICKKYSHFWSDFYGTNSFENCSQESGICVTFLHPFLTGNYKNECYLEEKDIKKELFKITQPSFARYLKGYLFV